MVGEHSKDEKHVNEMIHRANFRFDDLHSGMTKAKKLISKCQRLSEVAQSELQDQKAEMPKEELDQLEK